MRGKKLSRIPEERLLRKDRSCTIVSGEKKLKKHEINYCMKLLNAETGLKNNSY